MNEQIFDFLNVYASIPSPQYAITLRGKWGCGKTFFVKSWLAEFEKAAQQPSYENSIELRPIYVSLFGMRGLSDIKSAIDRCVNPFFYSKTGKFLKIAGRIASKIIFKTELDLDNDGKGETSFSGTLDSLSIFESDDKDAISGVKFIIFDDLERCQIPMKQLLGFINYFVEHCDCHVVIIGEEKYLDDKNLQDLQEFKEKVVGREFEILPDVDTAIKHFISLPMMATDFLEKEVNTIRLCFECTENNNLRLLRQSLHDFSLLISSLSTELVEKNHDYLRSLLSCFIAVYSEYRSKENHDFIVDWENCSIKALWGGEDNDDGKIRGLIGKYGRIDSINQFEALSSTMVPKIVEHIENGRSLAPMFEKILSKQSKKLSALERLGSYWDKTNEEFDAIYDSLIEELKSGVISEPVNIGKSIAFLGYFDARGFRKIQITEIPEIEKCLIKRIRSCQNLIDLYRFHYQFMQGYNYVRGCEQDKMKTTEIVKTTGKIFEELKEKLPDDMQVVLRQLSDVNVDSLSYLDKQSYPDQICNYQMRPIFQKENPKQLFGALQKMSNRGRNSFCQFLAIHYDFQAICDFADAYKPDHDVLVELRKLVAQEAVSKKSMEKWSYERLLEGLDKSIRRTNGEKRVE